MPQTISLLVPCYNAENYINSFISHLVETGLRFDEVIFYNDGSTDNTLELLEKSGYKFLNSVTNNGPGYARNRLAEAATSEYIHFHDVDDEFNTDFIKLIKTELDLNSPEVIIGYADWLDHQTRDIIIKWRYDQNEIQSGQLKYFIAHPLGIINTVYKRQNFLSIKGFNEQLHCWEDADLHIRLAADNVRFSVIPQVIAYSIRHNTGVSNDQKKCWNCRLKFLDSYLSLYSNSINKEIFKREVIKIKTGFLNSAAYSSLIKIDHINKKYDLGLNNMKIKYIYYLNKFLLPSFIIYKALMYLNPMYKKRVNIV